MKSKIYVNLNRIRPVSTAHGYGQKQVFLSNKNTENSLTQFAYGSLNAGEGCDLHKHETMEEYFFFLNGNGIYIVGEEKIIVKQDTFLRIPADVYHSLHASKDSSLKFIYFGISTK